MPAPEKAYLPTETAPGMELAETALDEPAWDAMDERTAEHARTVLETMVEVFDGVLVGPAALARTLIDEAVMGHRSVLEALTALVAHGLVKHRDADGTPVFWVPDRLIRYEPPPTGRGHPPPRTNGATTTPRTWI